MARYRVTDDKDPLKLGRVKLKLIEQDIDLPWAYTMSKIPKIDDIISDMHFVIKNSTINIL